MNILQEADKIVNERSEEKSRQYGDFIPCMERAAQIASGIAGHTITTQDMYCCMVGLKLSRESHAHKEDNLLDAVAYLASMNEFLNQESNKSNK